jgi:hypothetical protein
MIEGLDIERWLTERSVQVDRKGDEIIYTHFTGERSALFLPRDQEHTQRLKIESTVLAPFYDKYAGASFGDEHVIIGTNIVGGIESPNLHFELPDLAQMRQQAERLGFGDDRDKEIFMAEAAWMFIYSYDVKSTEPHLNRFDRDFRKSLRMPSFQSVLDNWWTIVLEDPLPGR